jgi:crossover junction endodeoxyribonuclease RuvC
MLSVQGVEGRSGGQAMPKKKAEVVHEPILFPDKYKVLAADLSLKRPSFCLMSLEKADEYAHITGISFKTVDNKSDKKKSHGQLLDEIGAALKEIYPLNSDVYLVRENEILKVKVPSERSLSKVVGLMDWMAFAFYNKEWFSIYPMTVKKYVTGSGKAEKSEVAECLKKYIGIQDYKCDDESDAAAVAIAWLIQQGQIKEVAV